MEGNEAVGNSLRISPFSNPCLCPKGPGMSEICYYLGIMSLQRRTKDLGRDKWRTVAGVGVRETVGGDHNFEDKIPDIRSDK